MPSGKSSITGAPALILVALGGVLSLLLALERLSQGTHPGLALIAAGILIPLVLACHRFDFWALLDKLKTHVSKHPVFELTKYFMVLFLYFGVLGVIAYTLWTSYTFILAWVFLVTPLGSLVLARALKAYL